MGRTGLAHSIMNSGDVFRDILTSFMYDECMMNKKNIIQGVLETRQRIMQKIDKCLVITSWRIVLQTRISEFS